MRRTVWKIIIPVLIVIVLAVGFLFSFQIYIVHGPSMQPNYWENEWIVVNKLAYKFHPPKTGDIIVFQPPLKDTNTFIKRIIGLPGESIEIQNGTVYVHKTNGSTITLQEPYIKEPFLSNFNNLVIPINEYFVMGDNRNNSRDSRGGWLVSRDKIIGKAWISIWPPHLWSTAPHYTQPATLTPYPQRTNIKLSFSLSQ